MDATSVVWAATTLFNVTNVLMVYALLHIVCGLWCVFKPWYNRRHFQPSGKHVLITGGSSGLGRELAKELLCAGAVVTIVARDKSNLRAAKSKLKTECGLRKHRIVPRPGSHSGAQKKPLFVYAADVTVFEQMEAAFAAAKAHHGGMSVNWVVCCAGKAVPGFLKDQSLSVFREQMDVNYIGSVNTVKAALSHILPTTDLGAKAAFGAGDSRIVLVSSAMAHLSFAGYSQYAASKYAVRGFAEALRNELLPDNVAVHLYCPGNIQTPGFEMETKIKPFVTHLIEGTSNPASPKSAAKSLLEGMAAGQFNITNEFPLRLLAVGTAGVAPRSCAYLDFLLWPLAFAAAFAFQKYMDYVVISERKKDQKHTVNH